MAKTELKVVEVEIPKPAEIAKFAKRFSKEEWAILCADKKFLICVTDDLKACRIHAEKVLGDFNKKKAKVEKAA